MVSDELVFRMAEAIAKAEGFHVPNSVPARCHDPGDLTDDGDVGFGTEQTAGPHGAKITVYGCDDDGWTALRRKVRRMLSGNSRTQPGPNDYGGRPLVGRRYGLGAQCRRGLVPAG